MFKLKLPRLTLTAARAMTAAIVSLPTAAAASQGPGTSAGTAGQLTQLAMAVLIYGTSALIVGTGLIGALRETPK